MTEETLEPVETGTDPEERIQELTAENRPKFVLSGVKLVLYRVLMVLLCLQEDKLRFYQ